MQAGRVTEKQCSASEGRTPVNWWESHQQDKPYTSNTQRVKDEQTIPATGKYKQDTISDLTQYKTVRLR